MITLILTRAEADAVRWAVGQMTQANACDIEEMMSCGLSRNEAKALLRADAKLEEAGGYKPLTKAGEEYDY